MGWRFNPSFSRSPLLFDHHIFIWFAFLLSIFLLLLLLFHPEKFITYLNAWNSLQMLLESLLLEEVTLFKAVTDRWHCFARCESAQWEDKLSIVSDRHREKEENQNHQNIAKDKATLCLGAASFSSEAMNYSFSEYIIVRSSLCSGPALEIPPPKLTCLQWCYFVYVCVNVYVCVYIFMYLYE